MTAISVGRHAAATRPPQPSPAAPAEETDRLGQMWQAIGFLKFRGGLDPSQDAETITRATRVLMARPGAPLIERMWGLDPDDHEQAADFSDVTRSLSDWAREIWGGAA